MVMANSLRQVIGRQRKASREHSPRTTRARRASRRWRLRRKGRLLEPVAVEVFPLGGAPRCLLRVQSRLTGNDEQCLENGAVAASALHQRLADGSQDVRAIA